MANGGNPTTFAGPGLVDLNGIASQNTLTTTNRFIIAGGVVRANNTQVGFTSAGAGIISLTGGILEIKGGANGTGAAADFTRALGAAASNVTWGGGTANEQGSGGFSAFGSNASVNLGGAASPTAVQWNTGNFVADGFALRFGSARSNAVLTFYNPIQLDNGTNYQLREIGVTKGVGGDRTTLAGVISGTANAELVKTGTGTLEVTASNTYAGNTYVSVGTLLANNSAGSATGTGRVVVGFGATLGGSGTISGSVFTSGTISPGNSPGNLTVQGNVAFLNGSNFAVELQSLAQFDQLSIGSSSTYSIGTNVTLSGTRLGGYTANFLDSFVIVNNPTGAAGTGTFLGLPNLSIFSFDGQAFQIAYNVGTFNVTGSGINVLSAGGSIVIAAVPEPATIALLSFTGLLSGAVWLYRRRRMNHDSFARIA